MIKKTFKVGDRVVLTKELDPVPAGTVGVVSWAEPDTDSYCLRFDDMIDDRTDESGLEIVGLVEFMELAPD